MFRAKFGALIAAPLVVVACGDSTRIVKTYSTVEELPGEQPVVEAPVAIIGTTKFQPVPLDPFLVETGVAQPQSTPVASTVPIVLPTDPEELEPTPTRTNDGIPGPLPGVYQDLGYADSKQGIRGLIGFPTRNVANLEQLIADLYDPSSSKFRQYLSPADWNAQFAPAQADVQMVKLWLESNGMTVDRIASNRLLLEFSGTVGDFNAAFGTQLKELQRNSRYGNEPPVVYGLDSRINAPKFVTDRITTVVALDLPAEPGPLQPEAGAYTMAYPSNVSDAFTPAQIAHAYRVDQLYSQGHRGQGVKLGVVVGSAIRLTDLQAFWDMFGVPRAAPTTVQVMEPPAKRLLESQIDVAWSGAMAPDADLVVYMGPDPKNTSVVYTFNEAIALGEVSVLTDSFAHREDAEPTGVANAYNASAREAAALGITVLSPSGDSAQPDVPSSSPYVTAVGGTGLAMSGMTVYGENAWYDSGSGLSDRFVTPPWQQSLPASQLKGRRAVADVSLNAEFYYWTLYLHHMQGYAGTSFASPVFAGIIASVNSGRLQQGKKPVGFLNSTLYTNATVQSAFRDITSGTTSEGLSAGAGWDMPTGWGSPKADELLLKLP